MKALFLEKRYYPRIARILQMINAFENYKEVLAAFGLADEAILELISSAWLESHRYWHTLDNHLLPLLKQIDERRAELTKEEYDALIIVAIFHDIVYDPRRTDNEKQSARVFQELVKNKSHPLHEQIEQAIIETAGKEPSSKISKIFQELDTSILRSTDLSELLAFEQAIFKEYQLLDFKIYRQERTDFLDYWLKKHPSVNPAALKWFSYLNIFD